MKIRSFICLFLVTANLSVQVWAADLKSQLGPLATAILEDKATVGLVVGVIANGQSQVFGYGETRKGSKQAPNGDTVYEIGSVTKAFTGALLAQLVEAGGVKLDDPLQKYLPEGFTAPIVEDHPITLEHLATHTSGLPRLPDNVSPNDPGNPYADYTQDDLYAFLKGHKLRRPPGEYEYSNYGMGLLGHQLAQLEKSTYEELIVARICKPLDMRDTRITLNEDLKLRLAPPYNASLEPEKNWDFPTLAGAGALRSTVNDLLKFAKANLAEDDIPMSKALRLAHQKRHAMPDGLAIALGWHIARDGITIWHNGMTGGYSSWLAVVPSRKVGIVVLSNVASPRTTELGEQVTRIACGGKAEVANRRKAIEIDKSILESYVGTYTVVPGFVLTVTVENGNLMVQATGQSRFPVFAESKIKFFYKVVDAQITFVNDADGKASKLILHQNGRDMEAPRNHGIKVAR